MSPRTTIGNCRSHTLRHKLGGTGEGEIGAAPNVAAFFGFLVAFFTMVTGQRHPQSPHHGLLTLQCPWHARERHAYCGMELTQPHHERSTTQGLTISTSCN
jgi:hypothetical protein